jgi:hypothetical protein
MNYLFWFGLKDNIILVWLYIYLAWYLIYFFQRMITLLYQGLMGLSTIILYQGLMGLSTIILRNKNKMSKKLLTIEEAAFLYEMGRLAEKRLHKIEKPEDFFLDCLADIIYDRQKLVSEPKEYVCFPSTEDVLEYFEIEPNYRKLLFRYPTYI